MRFWSKSILTASMLLLFLSLFTYYVNSSSDAATHDLSFLPLLHAKCWPANTPAGALESQPAPAFCSIDDSGPGTALLTANAWLDNFNHDLVQADFEGTGYLIFEDVGHVNKTIHWRHAQHWMVDVAPSQQGQAGFGKGGAMMRPAQSFRFEEGKLVVEATTAASMEAYLDNHAWVEIIITTSEAMQGYAGTPALYGYDMFPEDWVLGCRLNATRRPNCVLRDGTGDLAEGRPGQEIWGISWVEQVGTSLEGGLPTEGRENYWRVCARDDPDTKCRDQFRLEITETSVTLYVNDHLYFQQAGLPPLPAALLEGDVYVYFASLVGYHPSETVRFHWDDLAINSDNFFSAIE